MRPSLFLVFSWCIGSAVLAEDAVRFNRDIRPILSETCFNCHGPDERGRRAGLRLDTPEGAHEDLGGYAAIAPGNLDESEAWQRIISEDPDMVMPPPESHMTLTAAQKESLRRWIEQGAAYQDHWSFEPPVAPEIPAGDAEPIDALVRDALPSGVAPAPEADPRSLIRRLTFDLVGLPPTPEEIDAFVQRYEADGEIAYQELISRLLESPHHGEHWAVRWLDAARYADTNGYSIDGGRSMWLWRDWVIDAYNQNLPVDQFIVSQIAGDLLPAAEDDDETNANRIASGFNRNHMITHEGGTIDAENLTNYAADRVKTTGEVFLGLTMACAQCHDHKFDPISQREYYEFFAFFNELSDRGRDGDRGINARPSIKSKTVLRDNEELRETRAELRVLEKRFETTEFGFDEWLARTAQIERSRGDGFAVMPMRQVDVTTPNNPGTLEILGDGSVRLRRPRGGLASISHVFDLRGIAETSRRPITGLRVTFYPYADESDPESDTETATTSTPPAARLTPHPPGVPRLTTVLVSGGQLPAKQVDLYGQFEFSSATASSHADGHHPRNVLDERNVGWWEPSSATGTEHLTFTFADPVEIETTPFLTAMIFFGRNQSIPHHYRIDAIVGKDPDSIHDSSVSAALTVEPNRWTDAQRRIVRTAYRETADQLAPLRTRIANLRDRIAVLTQPHSAMVMDVADKPRETRILDRGQYDAPLDVVEPDVPDVLPPMRPRGERADRLDLAKWLVDPAHPLTARVAVNRIWSQFFGRGLLPGGADFGSQGGWPTHPELLDYLARRLIDSGWDRRKLIREIVSSATYRQSSAASDEAIRRDPTNETLARGPRRRLTAETVRDQALAISGLLVRRVGGPSVQPYQPPGLWKEVSHFGSTPATKQVFVQDRGEKLYRRSLYTVAKRTSPHPAMAAFDVPNREMCIIERGVTNTPLQALVLLNDVQFAEAARVLAQRSLVDAPTLSDSDRIEDWFVRCTSRRADSSERETIGAYLKRCRDRYHTEPSLASARITVGEFPSPDQPVDALEWAAWTDVATLMLNLSETLTQP